MKDKQALGQVVRDIRGDLTQYEFADELGVSHSAVSQWENGLIWVSLETAVKLVNTPGSTTSNWPSGSLR